MLEYSTGNETVDAMASIQFTGNVIPQIWYKTIVRDNGKPHLLAISILADIVYWYRPSELRNPNTGSFLGYKKKFNGVFLQRSYQQFSEQFGESKRTVTDAVIRLENLGVIERVFRTINVGGMLYNNVLFIKLNPDKLYDLTYPSASGMKDYDNEQELPAVGECESNRQMQPIEEKVCQQPPMQPENIDNVAPPTKFCDRVEKVPLPQNNGIGVTPKSDRGHIKKGEGSQNNGIRNTKNTSKNITENISSSSGGNSPPLKQDDGDDRLKELFGFDKAIKSCSPQLAECIFQEIKRQQEDLLELITPDIFLKICENINDYSSQIANKSVYIRKCLENMIAGKEISDACCASRKSNSHKKNSFNNYEMQREYDFEAIEAEFVTNL